MTRSPAKPKPVPVRRYRYSKWRWRVIVSALDALGALVMVFWRWFFPLRRPLDPRRILVVQLDHMGDAVLTSPLFPRLKAAFPSATIDVLASPSNREVFEADPHVDRVRLATRNWFERRPGGWSLGSAVWSLGRSLRGEGFDLGIDVRGDVLTVLVLALAGIPRRLGWAMGGGGFLLTDVAPWVPGRHEVDARLALLETLAIPVERPARVVVHVSDLDRVRVGRLLHAAWPDREGRARHQPASRSRAATARRAATSPLTLDAGNRLTPEIWPAGSWLSASAPFLAVHLGAGTRAKRWPGRNWANLVARFLADGWRVAVIGGPEDLDACRFLDPHPNLVDWTGQLSLTETSALLERADLFLGVDSGPAHLAACAGIPSVVLFSGTNLARQWRPWSRRSLVLKHRVSCRPCHQKMCPLENHPCMTGLHPDRVYRASQRWWRRSQQVTDRHDRS